MSWDNNITDTSGAGLPWGVLKGVRPVGLVSRALAAGRGTNETKEWFMREYRVSEEKADLALEIALRQRSIIKEKKLDKSYSLYVGIPFCPTTCLYCSFTSYPVGTHKTAVGTYLKALHYEIDLCCRIMGDLPPGAVYVGGGTPSSIESREIDELLLHLRESFGIGEETEFTFEAGRPDSIDEKKLAVLKSRGVTRISINPQTMNEATLRLIGRHHTVEQFVQAFAMARSMGFDDINTDLILGLPGEGDREVEYTLERIKELAPDALTVHSLAIKRGSRLHEMLIEKQLPEDFRITDRMQRRVFETAKSLGMKPYYLYRQKRITDNFENTGFAAEGKYCLYNVGTMEEVQSVLALGAGAVSKRVFNDPERPGHIERCDNVRNLEEYSARIDEMIRRKYRLFC